MAPVAEGFPGGGKERRKPHGAKAREAASGKRPAGNCPAAAEGRSPTEALHRQTLRGLRRETRPVERRSTPGAPGRRRETLGSPRGGGPHRDRFQGASRGAEHKRNGGVDLSATRAGGLNGKAQAGAGNPKGREDGRESRRNPEGAGGAARFHRRSRKAKVPGPERRIGGARSAPRPDARQAEGRGNASEGRETQVDSGENPGAVPILFFWPRNVAQRCLKCKFLSKLRGNRVHGSRTGHATVTHRLERSVRSLSGPCVVEFCAL